jgi:hypothetical protein
MKKALLAMTTIGAAALSFPASATAETTAPQLPLAIRNGGFEAPFSPVALRPTSKSTISGVVPRYWVDNSGWGEVTIAYSAETADVHGGNSALKIEFTAKKSGVCQVLQFAGQAVPGNSYTETLWIKGDGKAPVDVYLRMTGVPYTEMGKVTVKPDNVWKQVTVTCTAKESTPVAFMVRAQDPTTFVIDDATLIDNGPAK